MSKTMPTEIWTRFDPCAVFKYNPHADRFQSYTLTSTIEDKDATIRQLAEALELMFHDGETTYTYEAAEKGRKALSNNKEQIKLAQGEKT